MGDMYRKYKYEFFEMMLTNGSKIPVGSKLFVLRLNMIVINKRLYLKVYLLSMLNNTSKLGKLTLINLNDSQEYTTNFFYKVREFDSSQIIGCYIDSGEYDVNRFFDIQIKSYEYMNTETKLSAYNSYEFPIIEYSKEKIRVIEEHIPDFVVFPFISKNYWQCSCGEVNIITHLKCDNCSIEREKAQQLIKQGLNYTYLKAKTLGSAISILPNRSIEENLVNISNNIGSTEEEKRIIVEILRNRGFDEEHRLALIKYENDLELKKKEKEKIDSKHKRKKIQVLSFSVSLITFLLILALSQTIYRTQTSFIYGKLLTMFGFHEEATEVFGDLLNKGDYIDEYNSSKFSYGQSLLKKGKYELAKKLFDELGDYKTSKVSSQEASYLIGIQQLDEELFESAIRSFTLAHDYKDSRKYLSRAQYYYGINLYENSVYDKAKSIFESILLFEDSKMYLYLSMDGLLKEASEDAKEVQYLYGSTNQIVYNGLNENQNDLRVRKALKSDRYWKITLLGTWKTYDSKRYFRVTNNGKFTFNLPNSGGRYFKIYNDIVWYSNDKKIWKEQIRIDYIGKTYIKIYCYKNKTIYSLYKI